MHTFRVGDKVMTALVDGKRSYGEVTKDDCGYGKPYRVRWGGRFENNPEPGLLLPVPTDEHGLLRIKLEDSGWTMSDSIGGNQRWKKGAASIELMSDGVAFFCFSDRRMKNGTHAAIVGEFAGREYQSETEYRLEYLLEELASHFDYEGNCDRDTDLCEAWQAYIKARMGEQ